MWNGLWLVRYAVADHSSWYSEEEYLYKTRGERAYHDDVSVATKLAEDQRGVHEQHQKDVATNSAPLRKEACAVGFDACLKLVDNDEEDGWNRAEDNAENFALYALQRELILAYPDLDFSVEDRKWIVTKRDKLLHHCSLHHCMRHRDAGAIRDHPDYDPRRNSWGDHTGKKLPTDANELLEAVILIVHNRLKEDQERQADRMKKEKLRRRIYGLTFESRLTYVMLP